MTDASPGPRGVGDKVSQRTEDEQTTGCIHSPTTCPSSLYLRELSLYMAVIIVQINVYKKLKIITSYMASQFSF